MSDRQTSHIEMLRGIIESRCNENRKLRGKIVGRDKKIVELQVIVDKVKKADRSYGQLRFLREDAEGTVCQMAGEFARTIHLVVQAAGANDG